MNREHDPKFFEVLHDKNGEERVVLRQQIKQPEDNDNGFTTYDSSEGHCGLCGSISCRGGCFK